jgi:very-short-patch-repair endonuclease
MPVRRAVRARSLRQSAGIATGHVWGQLRGSRLDRHKFRREHPVDRFVGDFACESLRLIIEIDGGVHRLDDVVLRDRHRQEALEAMGWIVLHFTNDEALIDPSPIIAAIREHAAVLGGAPPSTADPHPTGLRPATFSQREKESDPHDRF